MLAPELPDGGEIEIHGEDIAVRAYSNEQNRVEVALNTPAVLVRDTKDRQAATLAITRPAWDSFLAGCREGAFNR